ncbi:polysaccharide biosynthesis/export family protein [Lichenihabitans sp. Uapishka_5]|uniref:polysaccharide biosynthesis/export family protein n=1 Tax=Lichenihabitans sp. Uapishka_5 TaxID=3037302 RepID=UPI0029E807BA|nr:polysaccharide biosynthesis/export family protein [Lichenihabitans sp. Uapishka_5]MDX7950265.1 polysaccharide biosynthesis/export family protein [Lichenihabitans sp. Uapishka_5]
MAAIFAVLPTSTGFAQQPAALPKYLLGPEDKVRIKVFEWRASQDEVFEWKALNDEFTVNAAGILSVPLAGDVPVNGSSVDEVARLIADRLRGRMNLAAPPDTSIDVVQYRPFFVNGDVSRPGPYPYRPGLTVLEALSIAGGLLRPADASLSQMTREIISAEGDLMQVAQDRDALLVRRARLQAEIAGDAMFQLPPERSHDGAPPLASAVSQVEAQIFKARQHSFVTQSQTLQMLRNFLVKEGESLDAQLTTVDTQLQLINKELAGVSSLVEKGMVVAPRQLALERSVAQIQGDRLSMQTSKLRVQEEMSKADLASVELANNRTTEASIELRDTQLKIDGLTAKAITTRRLLAESASAPGLTEARSRKSRLAVHYEIVRPTPSGSESSEVGEDGKLQPGDTVKVILSLPDEGPPGFGRSASDGGASHVE